MTMKPIGILYVEDNPDDVELTLRVLKKEGLANDIYVVHDGEEALDFLYCRNKYESRNPNHTPKLVLLDLKLPKVGGLDVLRELKSDESTKMIPVVVMTSSREEMDMVESYRLGVNSYIQKPVNYENFVAAVKQLGVYWLLLNQLPDK